MLARGTASGWPAFRDAPGQTEHVKQHAVHMVNKTDMLCFHGILLLMGGMTNTSHLLRSYLTVTKWKAGPIKGKATMKARVTSGRQSIWTLRCRRHLRQTMKTWSASQRRSLRPRPSRGNGVQMSQRSQQQRGPESTRHEGQHPWGLESGLHGPEWGSNGSPRKDEDHLFLVSKSSPHPVGWLFTMLIISCADTV